MTLYVHHHINTMNTENASRRASSPVPSSDGMAGPMKWLLLVPLISAFMIVPLLYDKYFPKGNRVDSRALSKDIANAITQYSADYNRLPRPASVSANAGADHDADTDTSAAEGLIRILTGKEEVGEAATVQNSRKTNYLEGMKAAKTRTGIRKAEVAGSDKWVSGLVIEEGSPEAVDGWGNYFLIRLDSNNDGEVANPNTDEVADGRLKLAHRAIVWSAGKDGKWETWGDNLKSWD
ncbi:MAG: hypothetical protein JWM59_2964 [Verrucomicrobiales bacterium]|nr:hypothetical protein [Verrucomicrobiales bacterium]